MAESKWYCDACGARIDKRDVAAIRAESAQELAALREALDGLPPATCYRTHTQPDEGKGVFGAVWKADVLRDARVAALAASPTPEPQCDYSETGPQIEGAPFGPSTWHCVLRLGHAGPHEFRDVAL